ncbi:MAG: hypothetical protein ABIE74_11060 [Pseudomonadota bacterium]
MCNKLLSLGVLFFSLILTACGVGGGSPSNGNDNANVTPSSWKTVVNRSLSTCGIKTDGTLWCWGNNSQGLLGIGTSSDACGQDDWYCNDKNIPTQVGKETDWDVLGNAANCAIKKDGTLWCWGGNTKGSLGNGTYGRDTYSKIPVRVSSDIGWKNVYSSHSLNGDMCGIKTDNSFWCWGYRIDGVTEPVTRPTQVGTDKDWVNFFIRADGNAFSLNLTLGGVLTPIEGTDWKSPGLKNDGTLWQAKWDDLSGTSKFEQIGVDKWVLLSPPCAIKADNSLWCWGKNDYGELGIRTSNFLSCPDVNGVLGSCEDKAEPTQVGIEANWGYVSGSCAIKSDGTLWCWGNNEYGQLGNGEWGSQCKEGNIAGHCADKTTPTQVK